ncbi:MAG TPA: amino acid permease [Pirellulales bacterium]|jgi:APA family basic amino acid/polyamine antiporter
MPHSDRAATASKDEQSLQPVLGLFSATALVIGAVIGSGIFLKPSQVAAATQGYVGLILALWIVLGLVNLCGSLVLAELSGMFPRAGGTYLFLREAYGPLWAFSWAWAEFCIIRSGAIATLAAAMAIAVGEFSAALGHDLGPTAERAFAIGSIAVLATVNIVGTVWGGIVQNVTTLIKVGFVALLALLPFVALESGGVHWERIWPSAMSASLLVGIGSAVSGIMWAYDGWANLPIVAEEVRNPDRNVPRALVVGVVLLIVLYVGANLAYHLTLPSSEIATAKATAVVVAEKLIPNFGGKLTLAMLAVSVFGALNANILTGPRVLFAVARDHAFLGPLRRIEPRFGTPAVAIAALSTWAALLVIAGDFYRAYNPDLDKRLYDVLSDYCIFGAALFYLAAVVAVFVLRRARPNVPRPYRAWGYPVLPAVFVVAYIFVLASMFIAAPFECSVGLGLIATGMVVYGVARGLETRR